MKRSTDTPGFNAEDQIGIQLLNNRIFFLSGEIEQSNIDACIKWILVENVDQSQSKTLTIYINSMGGDLYCAFALIDIIRQSYHPIRIVGIGAVMSAAFLIFVSGTKGQRYACQNTSFMCHQYSDEMQGKHHDLKVSMAEGERCNSRMIDVIQQATGLTRAKVKSQFLKSSDVYMTSQDAVNWGVADSIL